MINDVPMFEVAGFSIAMGNASDQVKAQAKATTASNDQDGWSKAIETQILPQSSPSPAGGRGPG